MLGEQATQFQMAAKSEDIDDQNCFPSRQFFDCLGYIIFRETGITHGILCHENFF